MEEKRKHLLRCNTSQATKMCPSELAMTRSSVQEPTALSSTPQQGSISSGHYQFTCIDHLNDFLNRTYRRVLQHVLPRDCLR
ncbi:hypothetical protein AVEN_11180-1 [Araneus ventricosus]|uniref:Uncharacterized protein n=1 Tax=Araneus ventricosus TaxID=182803 RepID=A0A4Y2TDP1_ARAVE|nr:hypothetical protein AVEN_11180-1 [Araneus ventricosus]